MNQETILSILRDTAHPRTAGSAEERQCADYLRQQCGALGLAARIEPFSLNMARIHEAALTADGHEIPCRGYLRAGSGDVTAELVYLTNTDPLCIKNCRGKIVLFDGRLRGWIYRDLLAAGAVGFITYDGDVQHADRDIDQKTFYHLLETEDKLPGVHIHARDAVELVRSGAKTAHLRLMQEEYVGESYNVVAELPGENGEWIDLTAHYDSTALSHGAYDNMTGSIALLALAEHFAAAPHRYGLRFIWCGSEEVGLLGSRAYCAAHEEELKQTALNVNLDMLGSLMGKFIANCTAEEKLVHYLQYFAAERGSGIEAAQGVHSSDSSCFAEKGVPAVSFARYAPQNTASIHNRYDTMDVVSAERLLEDIAFVRDFLSRMANAVCCPVAREIPENMQEKLDYYFLRKREKSGK